MPPVIVLRVLSLSARITRAALPRLGRLAPVPGLAPLLLVLAAAAQAPGSGPPVPPIRATESTAAIGVSDAPGTRQTPSRAPAAPVVWEGGDPAVAAGADFFHFANGGWIRAHPIPDDREGFSVATELRLAAAARLHALLEDAAARAGHADSEEQAQVGAYYAAYMDEARIDALGARPLAPGLAAIARARTHLGLARLMGRANRSPQGTLFALWVEPDSRAPDRMMVHLGQAGLGALDRDVYLNADGGRQRQDYRNYVARLLALCHWSNPQARARAILAFEQRIARVSATPAEQRDLARNYTPSSGRALARAAPGFPWVAFLQASGVPARQRVVVVDQSAVTPMARLFGITPVATLQAWAAFHLADNSARLLSRPFREAWFELHGHTLQGLDRAPPRWEWALTQVAGGGSKGAVESPGSMDDAVGRLYADRWFDLRARQPLANLVAVMKATLRQLILQSTWMSVDAQTEAVRKLEAYRVDIGVPEHADRYPGLRVRRDDLFGDVERAMAYGWALDLARLQHPSDRAAWAMTPQTVNAYNYAPFARIVFTAALLQPPAYDPGQDLAFSYGGIGAIIGHELTHAFDDVGRQFDAEGRLRDWWTPADQANFAATAARVVAQFSSCEAVPGAYVDGRLTLGENLADIGGLQLALAAYHASLDGQDAPVIDGLSGDQRFFLGFAKLRRGHRRPQALRRDLGNDPHTPDVCRVNQDVRNLDAWYAAFHVEPGAALYLAPAERVRLW